MTKLLYFGKHGCSPCWATKRMLDHEKVPYEVISNPDEYNITGVPTIIKMVDGKEVLRNTGFITSKAFHEKFD